MLSNAWEQSMKHRNRSSAVILSAHVAFVVLFPSTNPSCFLATFDLIFILFLIIITLTRSLVI